MAATWTSPKTWVASEMATAALFNTHIRDNITWLKTPLESGKITFASDFTTTSATYVDVTGITTTVTTNGGGLDVFFRATIGHSVGSTVNTFQLVVDGVSEAILGTMVFETGRYLTTTFYHHIAAISAGSHTIKVQVKTAAATLTIRGTTGTNGDPLFFVREAGG